jgi:hypothetical protein
MKGSWRQTLFTKKNRPLGASSGRFDPDAFHVLTSKGTAGSDHVATALRYRRPAAGLTVTMEAVDGRLFLAILGRTEDVLGPAHPFSREIPGLAGRTGRRIIFAHVYETDASERASVPSLDELLEGQRADLLDILTAAHEGREPVDAPERRFARPRVRGSAWDRAAGLLERGRARGAVFSEQGTLLEDLRRPGDPAQKKSRSWPGSGTGSARADGKDDERWSATKAMSAPQPDAADWQGPGQGLVALVFAVGALAAAGGALLYDLASQEKAEHARRKPKKRTIAHRAKSR